MPAGRPLQFDPERVLDAAMHTFWTRGFEGTAMPALLDATRLSRSSLYQAYGSKRALFEQCLLHYREQMARAMRARLAATPDAWTFLETVICGFVDEKSAAIRQRGCFVMNTARELECHDARTLRLVREATARMTDIFELAIRQARAEGSIPDQGDPRACAVFFLASVSGVRSLLQARVERSSFAPRRNAHSTPYA